MTRDIRAAVPSGADFKAARERAGITQAEASYMVGCDRSTLQRFERGDSRPHPMTCAALVRVYRRFLREAAA